MANEDARTRQWQIGLSVAAVIVAIASGWVFLQMRIDEPIVSGPGVTKKAMLSDTLPALKGGDGDTQVFELAGSEPGGTFMVLGGTHPQEIAGMLAAILLVENAKVTQGKLIVVPQANHSGFTHTDPMEAYLHSFTIDRPDGSKRWFRVGMRLSNPVDQWPDPDAYVHLPSGERMVGHESRNLNRNHPGLQAGTVTAEVSYALTQLVKGSNIVLDLHEAQPEYPVINKIVTHERAMETAVYAQLALGADGMRITVDPSAKNLHGLSHREFGDFTNAQALLAETANPAMGRFRGRLSLDLVIGGKEPNYVAATKLGARGLVFVPFDDNGWPLQVRVARHIATIQEIINNYNELNPKTPVKITGIPDYKDIQANGIGKYLLPPPAGGGGPPVS
jgi:predicted deacylase